MRKLSTIIIVFLLFLLLIAIRFYESVLFYDPLLVFFKTSHTTEILPVLNQFKLVIHTALRFLLNTGISLLVLWVLFKDNGIIRISTILYLILFSVLIILFVILLNTSVAGEHMLLFYVRRFLIQPLFLLVLIPAFCFQRKK